MTLPQASADPELEAGFTLVELMVSLFIFGLLAISGVALLRFSIDAQSDTKARLDQVTAIGKLTALMESDLAQAVPRITRDSLGNAVPAFFGGEGGNGQLALGFVRAGWSNPDALPRASLQRVEYRYVDKRIERVAYPMLDGAEPNEPSTILDHVQSFRLRYRYGGKWVDRWNSENSDKLPSSVELVIDRGERGSIRQLFLTGANGDQSE
jgi:general secretion pathway protein J